MQSLCFKLKCICLALKKNININIRGHTRDVSYMIMYCIWIRVKILFFPWWASSWSGDTRKLWVVSQGGAPKVCCWYFYPCYCGKTNKNNKPVGDVSFGTHVWQYWRLSIIYHRVYLSSSIYRIQLVLSTNWATETGGPTLFLATKWN